MCADINECEAADSVCGEQQSCKVIVGIVQDTFELFKLLLLSLLQLQVIWRSMIKKWARASLLRKVCYTRIIYWNLQNLNKNYSGYYQCLCHTGYKRENGKCVRVNRIYNSGLGMDQRLSISIFKLHRKMSHVYWIQNIKWFNV